MNYPIIPTKPAEFEGRKYLLAGVELANQEDRGLSEDSEPPTASAFQERLMADLLTGRPLSLKATNLATRHGNHRLEASRVLRVFAALLDRYPELLDQIASGQYSED